MLVLVKKEVVYLYGYDEVFGKKAWLPLKYPELN